jgi:hypothetical protein
MASVLTDNVECPLCGASTSDEHTFCESEDALLAPKRICKPLPDLQPVRLMTGTGRLASISVRPAELP